MTLKRMEHVGVVVEDLAAAVAFFAEIGLEMESEMSVGGEWVDRIIGLDGVASDLVLMRTPDGRGCLELTRFRAPLHRGDPDVTAPANAPGLRHILFVISDIEDVVARLAHHGGTLVGELVRYEESYVLAYVRGPAGVIVELAEELS